MAPLKLYQRIFFLLFLLLYVSGLAAQSPANDDCNNAEIITIPNSGYGFGTFTSTQIDLTNATIQPGENFAPALSVAGLDKKSVWFKFSLPSIRDVRISITQPGSAIRAGDAGFTLYKSSNCLPSNADISTKLTPIVTFGNTYHPCVPAGDYLVQVSSKSAANGPINIIVEITGQAGGAYDHPAQAYSFGVASNYARKVDFDGGCHSTDDASEVCSVLSSNEYNTTAWFTFTTPAYLDYLIVALSGTGGYFLGGGPGVYKTFGYTLYRGDAVTTPVNLLTVVDGCDSLLTNGYHCGIKQYRCGDLLPNTTYSIQLFIHKDFIEPLRLGILTGGVAPTVAPQPVTGIAPSHALGNLNMSPTGIASYLIGYFGCNSQHSVSACNPSIPAAGIIIGGRNYNLSSFGTFSLQNSADINLKPELPVCGPRPVIRLFKQSLTANCADLDMGNLIGIAANSTTFTCLSPGDYVVQILGIDSAIATDTINYKTSVINSNLCLFTSFTGRYVVTLTAYTRKDINKYSLNIPGAVDSINVVAGVQQPLQEDVPTLASPDTFGCRPTLRLFDSSCYPGSNRVMYRQFIVSDSGTVSFETLMAPDTVSVRYKMYSGDAAALASAQNVFNFPDKVSGLVANTECMTPGFRCVNKSTCVIPGTYTFATIGADADIGRADQPTFTFKRTRIKHSSPFTAQDMGSIIDTIGMAGGSMTSDVDTWSCDDNAVPVNDYSPCPILNRPATKAIYRQFYLKEPSLVKITSDNTGSCITPGIMTLFAGKATDGIPALSTIATKWGCFNMATNIDECKRLPAGWYTVISYGTGPNYDSTMRLLNANDKYNSNITFTDQFTILVDTGCRPPKFNRPYKASVQANSQPHLFEWAPTANSTSAYPETFKTDTLPTEYFDCTNDTPFSTHPITSCLPAFVKVAYYVFKTTQVSFLRINAKSLWAKVYDKDVRRDSLQFATETPIQECSVIPGYIQFCNLQPGTYTLVLFADVGYRCANRTPEIFIDSVGYSRFDFAQNAYDFGSVLPDSLYHFGKTGDVNPIDAARPPSSDFFYCTTGASRSDPVNSGCNGNVTVNDNIYSTAINQPLYNAAYPATSGSIARRNLWYTFVSAYPGTIHIKVKNKTPGRGVQPQFAVFSSNADGSLPFNTIQANGLVDSTINQGLQFIVRNPPIMNGNPNCIIAPEDVYFFRAACDATPTRYYIIVDNVYANDIEDGGQLPNTQLDVSILIDSLDQLFTKFDHYYEAGNIVTSGPGTYTAPQDNYSCASRNTSDPLYTVSNICNKTLWYKFNSTITGNVRYRILVDSVPYSDSNNVKLFRQIIPGDSTFNGLQLQSPEKVTTASGVWSEACVSPGTYYLLLPGCGRTNEFVFPEIELTENEGDFCRNAVPVVLSGAGNASNSVKVTCHTIGTDYGEFGPTLTCPQGAATAQYKTSWFRIDINGTDTLDVTTSLAENTNAAGADIKYRLMTGDCGAMQEQSCVLDALTQNTYQCLIPGHSYYVQVITPLFKNSLPVKGTIDLVVSTLTHTDTCAPLTNCLAAANFLSSFDCNTDKAVQFANNSTFGTSIAYTWDFGYNNQTSAEVSPSFFYPALSYDSTYNVKLVVKNTVCGQADSITKTVTVPARPFVNFGNDIAQCDNKVPVILTAPAYPGAVYLWQDNSSADSLIAAATGNNDYHVKVTYNGCSSSDTINVFISPIAAKPLQKIILCTGSGTISSTRGLGETYLWSTNEVTPSINVNTPGIYWVDLSYHNCVYRDSFDVSSVSSINNILGNDTTLCFSQSNYILNAFVEDAVSYAWQNGTTADTILITAPGEYYVTINIGNCIVHDTIHISDYPAAVSKITDTSFCSGSTLLLPWGEIVKAGGIYKDTLQSSMGCDSLINVYNVSLKAKPDLGGDTTINICSGSSINLHTIYNTGNNINNWISNNIPVLNASAVNNAGDYQLISITAGGCSDTVIVTIAVITKPTVITNNPGIVCANAAVDLTNAAVTTGSTTGLTFTYWQDTSAAIILNNPTAATGGTWYIKGSSANGCFDIKPVTVTNYPLPIVSAGDDFSICNNDSAILNAVESNSFAPVTFLWEPINEGGIRNPTAANTIVNPGGTQQYIITVKDSCNITAADTIIIIVQPPVPAFAGNDTIAVTNLPHQLMATGGVNYAWEPAAILNNPFIANPLAFISADSILFTVTVKDAEGCTGYDTVKVKTYNGITYYVPNAFSPDGNGINDVFRAIPVGIVSTDYFRIFNRYGQMVFETSEWMKGWDGTYKGKPQQAGNYVWMLKGKSRNGKLIEMKGNIMLVR